MAKRSRRARNYKGRTRTYTQIHRPNRRLRSSLMDSILNNGFLASRTLYNPYQATTFKPKQSKSTLLYSQLVQQNTYKNVRPLPYSAQPRDLKKAMVCARRQQRKEVLHAIQKTGKAGQNRPRRNQYSDIKC